MGDLDEKVTHYYEYFLKQGKTYSREEISQAIDYLSYRHADVLPKTESTTLPTLYIFRHGETEDNANFVFSGWRDPHLTEKGKQQALVLAEKIKDKKIQMLISSPQIRAIDTMKLAVSMNNMAKDLEINVDERIKERSYGDLQGKSKIEIYMKDKEALADIRRSFSNIVPGGESIEIVCRRVASFCNELVPLMKTHKLNVAVSCHGNSIRGFRRFFENLSDNETALIETPLGQDYLAYTIK